MNPAHGVPVKIWLYPLPGGDAIYRTLSDSAAGKVTDKLEQFEDLAGRLRVLGKRKAAQALPNMRTAVQQLQAHVTKFMDTFKCELKNLLYDIKRKKTEETAVLDVLRKLRELPLSAEDIEQWVEGREEEADILEVVSEHSKPGQGGDEKSRVTLVVRVYSGQPDAYSQLLDAAVRKYREGGHILNLNTKMSEDARNALGCKLGDKYKTMVEEFDHCYQNHKNRKDIHFKLAEEGTEDSGGKGPVYFEIHDIASHHTRFTERALLPDGVTSLEVRY